MKLSLSRPMKRTIVASGGETSLRERQSVRAGDPARRPAARRATPCASSAAAEERGRGERRVRRGAPAVLRRGRRRAPRAAATPRCRSAASSPAPCGACRSTTRRRHGAGRRGVIPQRGDVGGERVEVGRARASGRRTRAARGRRARRLRPACRCRRPRCGSGTRRPSDRQCGVGHRQLLVRGRPQRARGCASRRRRRCGGRPRARRSRLGSTCGTWSARSSARPPSVGSGSARAGPRARATAASARRRRANGPSACRKMGRAAHGRGASAPRIIRRSAADVRIPCCPDRDRLAARRACRRRAPSHRTSSSIR